MTLGFLIGGGGPLGPAGAELHDEEPLMRRWYDQVARWTGFTTEELLTGELGRDHAGGPALLVVRHAALAIGVHDVLADRDIRPAAVTGFSMGGMTAACLAGAITRPDLFTLLLHWDDNPEGGHAPEQAVAVVRIPPGADEKWYHGENRPGVYLSCDYGPARNGEGRLVMLSGTRAGIRRLADEAPEGTVDIMPVDIAYHSPLRRPAADNMAPHIAATAFTDPVLPLISCLERGVLTRSGQVRDFFLRNPVSRLSAVNVFAELLAHGTRLCLGLGPALPPDFLTIPFPLVNIVTPEDLAEAAGAIYELGIDLDSVSKDARSVSGSLPVTPA